MMLISDDNVKIVYLEQKNIDGKVSTTTYVACNMKYQGQYLINDMENYKDLWVITDIYHEISSEDQLLERRKIEMYYRPKKILGEEYEVSSIKSFIEGVKGYRTDWYDRDNKRFSYKTIETGGVNSYGYKKYEWVHNNQRFLCGREEYQGPLLEQQVLSEIFANVSTLNNKLEYREKPFQKVLK